MHDTTQDTICEVECMPPSPFTMVVSKDAAPFFAQLRLGDFTDLQKVIFLILSHDFPNYEL